MFPSCFFNVHLVSGLGKHEQQCLILCSFEIILVHSISFLKLSAALEETPV